MDNAKLHHAQLLDDTNIWESLERTYNIIHMFLPPYSPFLNPIELVFNTVKYRLDRKDLTKENVKQKVQEEFERITEEECRSYCEHANKHLKHCAKELPFSGKILTPDLVEDDSPILVENIHNL